MRRNKDTFSDKEVNDILESTERRYQALKTAERISELRREIFAHKSQIDSLRRLGFFDLNLKRTFDAKIKEVTVLMKSAGFSNDYSNTSGERNDPKTP